MPTIFILLLAIYLIGNLYVFYRGKKALKSQSTGVKVLLSILYWGCALSFFGSFLLRNVELPDVIAHTWHEVGTGWLVFIFYLILWMGLFDLLALFRIRIQGAFYFAIGITLTLLSYGYYNYRNPDTQQIEIAIHKPAENRREPLRVVAVSDIHLGYGTNKETLAQYVKRINAERPDLILIAGDLIDNSLVPLRAERMDEELSLLHAPYGIYMVPGNHEYISDIDEVKEFLGSTPIVLLQDSIATLSNGVQIIGRDDRHNKQRKSLSQLVAQANPDEPMILLDHQPYELSETVRTGIDLQFSGHTHRGQVWPASLVTDYLFELSYGHRQEGTTHLYVSSGLSLWGPPFRIGTKSELVVFTLLFP